MKGELGAKGQKGEPGAGYYDPQHSGAQGPAGRSGPPVTAQT